MDEMTDAREEEILWEIDRQNQILADKGETFGGYPKQLSTQDIVDICLRVCDKDAGEWRKAFCDLYSGYVEGTEEGELILRKLKEAGVCDKQEKE